MRWRMQTSFHSNDVLREVCEQDEILRGAAWNSGSKSQYRAGWFASGVGRDWIRALLFALKKRGVVTCTGKGKAARWRVVGE